jgi:hypothetical protein
LLVADEEILRRIDRSLERIDVHMERGNELAAQNRASIDEHRAFLRELNLRSERVMGGMIRSLETLTEEVRQQGREFRRELREQRREFVEESRAQRAALFRMLDRLDGGGAPAGA